MCIRGDCETLTNKNAKAADINRLDPPVTCPCGRVTREKGQLILHLEKHGLIWLARELTKILIDQSKSKEATPETSEVARVKLEKS